MTGWLWTIFRIETGADVAIWVVVVMMVGLIWFLMAGYLP